MKAVGNVEGRMKVGVVERGLYSSVFPDTHRGLLVLWWSVYLYREVFCGKVRGEEQEGGGGKSVPAPRVFVIRAAPGRPDHNAWGGGGKLKYTNHNAWGGGKR